jgi:hypothetical protein
VGWRRKQGRKSQTPPPSVVVRMLVLTGLVQNEDMFPGELQPLIIENREEEQLPILFLPKCIFTIPVFLYIFLSLIEGGAVVGKDISYLKYKVELSWAKERALLLGGSGFEGSLTKRTLNSSVGPGPHQAHWVPRFAGLGPHQVHRVPWFIVQVTGSSGSHVL